MAISLSSSYKNGFTVVELIVVIVIIALLASVGLLGYSSIQRDARDRSLLSDIDSIESLQASYMLSNGGNPTDWYSAAGGENASLNFTPSEGNVIDVVTAGTEYCIRGYNASANRNTLESAYTKGSTAGACELMDASEEAGGSGGKIVGWWKLNGGAVDSSGEGRDGTISGATPTTGQNGQPNSAYAFSTTSNQWINTGYNFPLETLSVSMWVRWAGASPNSYATLISNARDCCDVYNGFQMHIAKASNAIGARLWYGSSAGSMAYSTIPIDSWTHVVLTYDKQIGILYINGQRVTSTNLTQDLGSSAFNVSIGKGGWSNNYGFGGDIDDVRIYNYGISADTVKAIYDTGAL